MFHISSVCTQEYCPLANVSSALSELTSPLPNPITVLNVVLVAYCVPPLLLASCQFWLSVVTVSPKTPAGRGV